MKRLSRVGTQFLLHAVAQRLANLADDGKQQIGEINIVDINILFIRLKIDDEKLSVSAGGLDSLSSRRRSSVDLPPPRCPGESICSGSSERRIALLSVSPIARTHGRVNDT
jgi:hypothetical protein